MDTPAKPAIPGEILLDATGRIDENVHCLKCGYNLRGLLLAGVCPECGTPVGRSAQGDLLRFCSPDWVDTLASGMNWIVAGIVLSFLAGCGTALVAGFTATYGGAGTSAIALVGVAMAVVSLIGYWKVTTPDPSRLNQDTSLTARQLVRITIILSLLMNTPEYLPNLVPVWLTTLIALAGGAAGIVNTFASFIYARQLALRIPDLSLASQTRIVMWGIAAVGVAGLGMVAFGVAAVPAMLPTPGPGTGGTTGPAAVSMAGFVIGGCAAGVGGLVFGIWALILLFRYRGRLVDAARQARATWARDPMVPLIPPATMHSE